MNVYSRLGATLVAAVIVVLAVSSFACTEVNGHGCRVFYLTLNVAVVLAGLGVASIILWTFWHG